MKYIIALLLTLLLAYALSLYFPWYIIALAAFLVGVLIHQQPLKAFLAGFAGIFVLWGALAFYINWENKSLLSTQMAHVFPLQGEGFLLMIIGAFVGGLVGGLAALTGSYFRRLI